MRKHTKIYYDYFGLDAGYFVPCEVCGAKAVDIQHISPRGMGGSKTKDFIENLMAMCRKCHNEADFGTKLPKELQREIHKKFMLSEK